MYHCVWFTMHVVNHAWSSPRFPEIPQDSPRFPRPHPWCCPLLFPAGERGHVHDTSPTRRQVCPLISLIEDQVFALRQWDVSASFLATSQDGDEAREVMHQLHRPALVAQENGLRLLYVTPERITSSPSFTSALTKLYNAGQLRRFVIDEAHKLINY